MKNRSAAADVTPVRQRTQYSCMAASMAMCLRALGHDVTEDEVNDVMGARPMRGAAWEQAIATAQHYGCRATLTSPSTVEQLKAWTDRGVPVMIAWNPEGRPWSHASVVFDVDELLNVHVADPNIPNPKKTVRVVAEDEFYGKWSEKFPNYLVRRPACAIEREISETGEQMNLRTAGKPSTQGKLPPPRNPVERALAEKGRPSGGGSHHNRERDFDRGRGRRPKHKRDWSKEAVDRLTARYLEAARPSIEDWIKQVKGAEIEDSKLNIAVRDIYLKATREGVAQPKIKDTLPMLAWDMGYEGYMFWKKGTHPLDILMVALRASKAVMDEWTAGRAAREENDSGRLATYDGNPDGKPIYPVKIDHGEHQPLTGGHDVMKRLYDQYLIEQGKSPRESNPRLAGHADLDEKQIGLMFWLRGGANKGWRLMGDELETAKSLSDLGLAEQKNGLWLLTQEGKEWTRRHRGRRLGQSSRLANKPMVTRGDRPAHIFVNQAFIDKVRDRYAGNLYEDGPRLTIFHNNLELYFIQQGPDKFAVRGGSRELGLFNSLIKTFRAQDER